MARRACVCAFSRGAAAPSLPLQRLRFEIAALLGLALVCILPLGAGVEKGSIVLTLENIGMLKKASIVVSLGGLAHVCVCPTE